MNCSDCFYQNCCGFDGYCARSFYDSCDWSRTYVSGTDLPSWVWIVTAIGGAFGLIILITIIVCICKRRQAAEILNAYRPNNPNGQSTTAIMTNQPMYNGQPNYEM